MAERRSVKRVVLVTPPYHCGVVESAGTWLPLALVYLAGSLRAAGHEVVIYDAMSRFHGYPEIGRTLEDLKPDVVATTAITATFLDAVEVLRLAKRVDPRTVTVLGNVHPTFLWDETLRDHADAVDFVVRGEGEATLVELLAALGAGADPARVRGIAYRVDGRPVTTPPRTFQTVLDALPAAWDLLDWGIYSYRPKPGSTLAVVSSSRGCVKGCTFCSQQRFWQRRWRARSPESFVDELEHLRSVYGVNVAMLADETPTVHPERWRVILGLLRERRLDVELLMETRVTDILRDEPLLPAYREAGISHIYAGVEAVRQESLDLFEKDLRVEDSRRAIALINQADIVSETSLVLGMPDETTSSIRETVDLAIHYDPDMAFFLAIAPWPYAEIYPQLREHIEVFDYRSYNLVTPVVKPEALTRAELAAEMDRAHRIFYAHKMRNLDALPAAKRAFMLAVMDLLVNHSYLGEKMRGLAEDGRPMPPEMRAIFDRIRAAAPSGNSPPGAVDSMRGAR